jgi:hypothetical protein
MTIDFNEHYSYTVSMSVAEAQAYRRDTQTEVGPLFIGVGNTMNHKLNDVESKVKNYILSLPIPPS